MLNRLKGFFGRGKAEKTVERTFDLHKQIEALRSDALATYERFQSGNLKDGDTVELAELDLPNLADYLQRLHDSSDEFETAMGGFASAYSPFGIFNENEVVIESGADWGYSVLAMRSHACRAKIISVEAAPFHRAALDRLVVLEDGRYDWMNAALGEVSSELSLYTPVVNRNPIGGLTSVGTTLEPSFVVHVTSFAEQYVKLPDDNDQTTLNFRLFPFSVKAYRLIDVIKKMKISPSTVAAIKLDIEGHEGPVLSGARDFLATHKPLIMNEGANRDTQVRTVMQSLGYQHYHLDKAKLIPESKISHALDGYWLHPTRLEDYRTRGLLVE